MDKTYPVSKYLSAVKNLLQTRIPRIWVNGVITQIAERGRVVYLSIAEFSEGDVKPIAKLDLFMFAGEFAQMQTRISELPMPFTLKEQLKVNFQVEADFYVPSGKFQCHVVNIDPSFTLGELALTRQAIIERLTKEGLLNLNKSRLFATVPLKVGLITGEGTAAYKDFTTTLAKSGYAFEVILQYAKMQGNETENTVLAALGKLREITNLDAVCIVRGGGSKTDLNYFDSEALCRAIANFPIPVFTGIGHEIDKSLVDIVAYESCITPTDCAKKLIARIDLAQKELKDLIFQIAVASKAKVANAKETLFAKRSKIVGAFSERFAREKEHIAGISKSLVLSPFRIIEKERISLARDIEGLNFGVQKILALQKAKFEVVETKVKANDPKRVLAKGYTYTTKAGKGLVKSAKDIQPGDMLSMHFADGSVQVKAE
ncbi:MAG: exodeoxyribonuclease VII large subunit [Fibrobacteraceae bacterium]|nr:exodeoxyribonuclease VII large subunit [Fibrobacteraceae bacterium]